MNSKAFKMFVVTLSVILLAGSSVSVFAAPVLTRQTNNNLLVLQFADVLEQLESCFYSEALSKFQDSDFTNAGFLSSQIPLEQISSIQSDEQTHSTALQAAIKDIGGKPVTSCTFNFDAALQDVVTMTEIARVIENVGVGAYLGAAHLISDPVLLTVAGSILTVEARHQTVLNILSGTGTVIPAAFDIALRPEEVLAIAIAFFSGPCDLGIQPNPTLTITNRDPVAPGTLLTFQSTAINKNVQDQLFCQIMTGGKPFALVLPFCECVVPKELNGPVVIFVTCDDQPLANDVVNRTPNNLVAGPTMTFIDTNSQQLGQLVLGGKSRNGGSSSSSSGSGSSSGSDESTLTRTVDPAVATSIMDGAMGSAITVAATPNVTLTSNSDCTSTTSDSSGTGPTVSFAPTNTSLSSGAIPMPTPTPTVSPNATGSGNSSTGEASGGISVDGSQHVPMPS